jgi:uncharacterized phosphosugar-binding protein
LYEICDLYLDNFGAIGDASIELNGLNTKVGATSTVIGAALLQAIMVQATELLIEKGFQPEIWSSANTESGEESNESLTKKYKSFVQSL